MGETDVLAELLGERPLSGAAPIPSQTRKGMMLVPVAGSLLGVGLWVWLAGRLVEMLYSAPATASQPDPAVFAIVANGMVFAGVIAIAIVGRRWFPVPDAAQPLAVWRASVLGFGLGAGGLLLSFAVALLKDQASIAAVSVATGAGLLSVGVLTILFQTAAEELFFRGWLQPLVADEWGNMAGLAVTSAAFAALHFFGGARDPLSFLNILLAGLFFGLLALRSGGLAAPLAAHFAWNGTEQLGLGLDPNPGVGAFGSLIDYDISGLAIWGGSIEGLNASLATSLSMLAMIIPLALWKRNNR